MTIIVPGFVSHVNYAWSFSFPITHILLMLYHNDFETYSSFQEQHSFLSLIQFYLL